MRAQLSVAGLPALPPDQQYQLWFIQPDQMRVSGGVFRVTAAGTAVVDILLPADYRTYQRVGITVEPAGGSPTPTGPNVLMGNL
jgi:anti-sigma-K factor RskA